MAITSIQAFALLTTEEKYKILNQSLPFAQWISYLYADPEGDTSDADLLMAYRMGLAEPNHADPPLSVLQDIFDSGDTTLQTACVNVCLSAGLLSQATMDAIKAQIDAP